MALMLLYKVAGKLALAQATQAGKRRRNNEIAFSVKRLLQPGDYAFPLYEKGGQRRQREGEVHASAVVLDKLCGGLGMTLSQLFSRDETSPLSRRERLKILGRRVDALLAEARQMDVSLDDVIDLVRQRDRAMAPSRD